jgi:hypothetical protein
MVRRTLLSYLTQPNPVLDRSELRPGPNSPPRTTRLVTTHGWQLWDEFNFSTLHSKFYRVLDAHFTDLAEIPRITGPDLNISNEDSFEHQILSRDIMPTVNSALSQAKAWLLKYYKKPYRTIHLKRGSVCSYDEDNRVRPDWSLIDPDEIVQAGYFNANWLPGDSKISTKWGPDPNQFSTAIENDSDETFSDWYKPVSQIAGYIDQSEVRYGYLITDMELVVMEFCRERIGPGIAATRSRRPTGSQLRISSIESTMSSVQAMSISTGEGQSRQSYQDTAAEIPVFVRYQTIPWENQGTNKKLSIRLALFCLCLMAGYGPARIGFSYVNLESWSLKSFPRSMIPVESDEIEEEEDDEDDEADGQEVGEGERQNDPFVNVGGEDFVKRSVTHFDPNSQRHYFVDQAGNSQWIKPFDAVYDEETRDWGYLRAGEWVPYSQSTRGIANTAPNRVGESSGSRKRR